jgi:hypothetical protein
MRETSLSYVIVFETLDNKESFKLVYCVGLLPFIKICKEFVNRLNQQRCEL